MASHTAILRPLDVDAPAQRVQTFLIKEARGAGWQGQAIMDPLPGDEDVAPLKIVADAVLAGGLAPGSSVALTLVVDDGSPGGEVLRAWPAMVARVETRFAEGRPVNDVRLCDPLTYLATARIWGAFANASPAAVVGGALSLAAGGDGEPTVEPTLPGLPVVRVVADLDGGLDTVPYAIAVGETLGVWLARLLPRLGIRVETVTDSDGEAVLLILRDGEPAGEVLPMIATYGQPSFHGAKIQRFSMVDVEAERPALLDNQTGGDVTRLGGGGVVGNVISAAGVGHDEARRRAGFGARAQEVDERTFTVVSEQFQAYPGARLGFIASSAFGERTFQIADVLHSLHQGRYRNTIWLQKDGVAWHPPIPANDGPAMVSGVIDDAESDVGTAVARDREGRVPVRLATLPRLSGENGDAVFPSPRAHLPIVNPMGGGDHGFVHAHRQGDLCRVLVHQPLFAEIAGFGYRDDRRLSANFADVSTGLTVRSDDEGWAGLVFVPKDEIEELLGEWDELDWESLSAARQRASRATSPLMQRQERTRAFQWQAPRRPDRYAALQGPWGLGRGARGAEPLDPDAGPGDVGEPPDPDEVLSVLDGLEDSDLEPSAMRALSDMREELEGAGLRDALEELGVDTAGMDAAGLHAAAQRAIAEQRAAGGFGAAAKLAAVVGAFVLLAAGAAAAIVAKFPFLATNATLKGLAASGVAPPGAGSQATASALAEAPPVNVDQATAKSLADQFDAQRGPGDRFDAPRRPGDVPRRGDESGLYERAADELRRGNDPMHVLEDELQQARLRELAGEPLRPDDVVLHERVRDAVKGQLLAAGATDLVTAAELLKPRVPSDWSFTDAWEKLLKALDDVPAAAAAPAVLLLARGKVADAAGGLRKLLPEGKRPDKEDAVREAVQDLRDATEDPDQALALDGALNHFDAVAQHSISEGLTRIDAYQPRPKAPLPAHVDKAALLQGLEHNRQLSKDAAEEHMAAGETDEANRFREHAAAYALAIGEVNADYDPTAALREELRRIEHNAALGRLFFPDQLPVYAEAVGAVADVLRENGVLVDGQYGPQEDEPATAQADGPEQR